MINRFSLQSILLWLALAALASPLAAQTTTFGSDLVNRANNDSADGMLYLYDTPSGVTGRAQTFSFFDNESGSRVITPLIFEKLSDSQFVLRGVGTTRVPNGTGAQSYPFGLIAGSDAMGPNHTFGFIDRSVTISNGALLSSQIRFSGGSVTRK